MPDYWSAYLELGNLLEKEKNYNDALDLYMSISEIFPNKNLISDKIKAVNNLIANNSDTSK